jgi:uncharacterized iron-regulated protein
MEYAAAARRIAQTNPSILDFNTGDEQTISLWVKREQHMAERILRGLKRIKPKKALYIGGWNHLTRGGRLPTLRGLLDVELAQCLLLDRGMLER